MKAAYDVVVVGSGAGGAPIAAELAEAGFDVIVLEEGRYYTTRDFTADSSAMVRQLYDVEADVRLHELAGHLTVVPLGRLS